MNEMASSDNRGGEELGHQRRVEQGDLSDSSYYVDLILQELSKPISQDHSPGNRDEQRPSSHSTNEDGPKETALDRLQRTLPIWKRQLVALSRELGSTGSQANEARPEVLNAKAHLEVTTQHLSLEIAKLRSTPTRSDDHHLKRLKSYRLEKLHSILTATCISIGGRYFKDGEIHCSFGMKLSLEECERRGIQHHQTRTDLERAAFSIGTAIECIDESDWDLALKDWKLQSGYVTRQLNDFVHYTRPQTKALVEKNRSSGSRFHREPVIHPAKLMIPIIKLARLFLKKVTTLGMNTKRVPLFTDMSSERIDLIAKSHGSLSGIFGRTLNLLKVADTSPRAGIYHHLIKIAQEVQIQSEAPWLHVLLHLVSSITDTSKYPTQNDIKSWIINWNTQRMLAIDNFIRYARSLIDVNQL
ncbi:hypothetical protein PSTG_05940 [Puccinia striiformis f. sp. tritici PST-78]|uniref:Uncharacterized protein n=1 Tax=Puccinia striiformis f. sp. tritici PST-78 TaxID=1165861 RepID=A0A0L0VNL9_9BASI|nr:hypothetical protein PSTG_05940 [Puccinia striiformis f. sp. tritici PST-78]